VGTLDRVKRRTPLPQQRSSQPLLPPPLLLLLLLVVVLCVLHKALCQCHSWR
jgi:hypothetical protein